MVRLLLESMGAEALLKATDEEGMGVLHHAVGAEEAEVLRLLLLAGADANAADKEGRTPRALALQQGREGHVTVFDVRTPKQHDMRWTHLTEMRIAGHM